MKTIDVQFPRNATYGGKANDFAGQHYAYFITDAQAQQITAGAEYAVVQAPGNEGPLQVVKIVGEPSDTPEKATRHIICVVDMAAYKKTLETAKAAKKLRAQIDERVKTVLEAKRLEALAGDDPQIKALLDQLKALEA